MYRSFAGTRVRYVDRISVAARLPKKLDSEMHLRNFLEGYYKFLKVELSSG